MGYIIAILLIVCVVPLLFILLSRRTSSTGGIQSRDHGVTVESPAAEDVRSDEVRAPSDRKLPPA